MKTLLEIENLRIKIKDKVLVDSLSLSLPKHQTIALVGESGSGKSLTALSLLGLHPNESTLQADRLDFNSNSLLDLDQKTWEQLRGNEIGMVFQEPQSSLNPSMRCGDQVLEVLQQHQKSNPISKEDVLEAFEGVLLPNPNHIYTAYPHELSGGQKQRVMIAMAIICKPKLLICDEPTTALDVTVQKEILNLLKQLQIQNRMSILFISHDLALVKRFADRVLVMQKGRVVEQGSSKALFSDPKDPYTKGLLSARPPLKQRPVKLITVTDYMNKTTDAKEESKQGRKKRLKSLYNQQPLMEVKRISKSFPRNRFFWQKKESTEVLAPLSFDIYPGETLGLVGESGSGISTL